MSKNLDDIKNREVMLLWDKSIGNLFTGWMVSGIEVARVRFWRLCGTVGTCHCDVKGEGQEFILKTQSTSAQCRGGLTRSSDEESVMDSEQRGQAVLSTRLSTIMGGTNDEDKAVKRLRGHKTRTRVWLSRTAKCQPWLFPHWRTGFLP